MFRHTAFQLLKLLPSSVENQSLKTAGTRGRSGGKFKKETKSAIIKLSNLKSVDMAKPRSPLAAIIVVTTLLKMLLCGRADIGTLIVKIQVRTPPPPSFVVAR